MLAYVSLLLVLLYRIAFWDITLLKSTIYWVFGVGIVQLISAPEMDHPRQLTKAVADCLRLTVLLQFVVALYPFSLWVELILVPSLFVLVGVSAVAGFKEENQPVKKATDALIWTAGLAMAVGAAYQAVTGFHLPMVATASRSFPLPVVLTAGFLPFLYAFSLTTAYETLFMRIGFFTGGDRSLCRFAKRQVVVVCRADLRRLRRFSRDGLRGGLTTKDDVMQMVDRFRSSEHAGEPRGSTDLTELWRPPTSCVMFAAAA